MTAVNSEMVGNSIGRKFAHVERNCWPSVSGPSGGTDSLGPSRLTPKQYLSDQACAQSIILEINEHLAVDKAGCSPLEVVYRTMKQYAPKKVIKSTLVVRWISPTKVKARFCIMGDMVPIRGQVSSPTPFRSDLKTFLFVAAA